MYEILFYEDKNGNSEIKEFIWELEKKALKDKNSSQCQNT